jgi:hypothetical protein
MTRACLTVIAMGERDTSVSFSASVTQVYGLEIFVPQALPHDSGDRQRARGVQSEDRTAHVLHGLVLREKAACHPLACPTLVPQPSR